MRKHNWAQLDKNYKYSYRDDRLQLANKLGFKFISQATVTLYRKYKSTTKVAKILNLTNTTIRYELKKYQEPRGTPGGCHKGSTAIQTWRRKKFNKDKFYLGRLCLHSHNWQNTGQTLRYKTSSNCVICQANFNKK